MENITPETNFNSVSLTVGGCMVNDGLVDSCYPYQPQWYPQIIKEYYPVYYTNYIDNKSNIEKAFKIVQKLIDKKLVKVEKVKNFVELVNDIAEII